VSISGDRSSIITDMTRRLTLGALAACAALVAVLSASAAPARPYVQILSHTPVVARGGQAALVAKVTPPNARCILVIYLYSGQSQASGLGPKRAVNGQVTWQWTIANHTYGGTYPVYVECGTTGIAKTWIKVL
jgi:hypothetical protein